MSFIPRPIVRFGSLEMFEKAVETYVKIRDLGRMSSRVEEGWAYVVAWGWSVGVSLPAKLEEMP